MKSASVGGVDDGGDEFCAIVDDGADDEARWWAVDVVVVVVVGGGVIVGDEGGGVVEDEEAADNVSCAETECRDVEESNADAPPRVSEALCVCAALAALADAGLTVSTLALVPALALVRVAVTSTLTRPAGCDGLSRGLRTETVGSERARTPPPSPPSPPPVKLIARPCPCSSLSCPCPCFCFPCLPFVPCVTSFNLRLNEASLCSVEESDLERVGGGSDAVDAPPSAAEDADEDEDAN